MSGKQLLSVICRWLRSVHKGHDPRVVTDSRPDHYVGSQRARGFLLGV